MLSAAQKLARYRKISASQIAKIAGTSPYGGPYSAWLEIELIGPDKPQTLPQRIGSLLEPAVLDLWEDRYLLPTRRSIPTMTHPERTWQCASPDAIAVAPLGQRDWLIEAKTVAYGAEDWGPDRGGAADIPAHYYDQVQWQMSACGYDRCDVIALIQGREVRVYEIAASAQRQKELLEFGREFFEKHVGDGKPAPDFDGSDDAKMSLLRRFPRDLFDTIIVGGISHAEAIEDYLALRATIADGENECEKIRQWLCSQIGDATAISAGSKIATWKTDKNGRRIFKIAKQKG
jgi:putative phage-type endonuclease